MEKFQTSGEEGPRTRHLPPPVCAGIFFVGVPEEPSRSRDRNRKKVVLDTLEGDSGEEGSRIGESYSWIPSPLPPSIA